MIATWNDEGKVALITGGSSGIGLATAKRLKIEGAIIAITGRNKQDLLDAPKEIGDGTLYIQSNVAKLSAVGLL